MQYTTLGRTGLKVSVAGLGCGGPSRLGMRDDPQTAAEAVALVKKAIDLGINVLDTAQNYGTEAIVGQAIADIPRDRLVISTKKTLPAKDHPAPEAEVVKGLEQSLSLIGTDYVDVYHLHGVEPKDYRFAKDRLLPAMRRLKEQGKIRFIGMTEGFVADPAHSVLQNSLELRLWDVVMVGFNLLNPSARKTVFPLTTKHGIGVLNMFAVRRALSQPEALRKLCTDLVREGRLGKNLPNADEPLGFLLAETDAASIPEAAYRFCRHEKGVDVVLFGTGKPKHLEENIAALLKPPLPSGTCAKLEQLFGEFNHLTGN